MIILIVRGRTTFIEIKTRNKKSAKVYKTWSITWFWKHLTPSLKFLLRNLIIVELQNGQFHLVEDYDDLSSRVEQERTVAIKL